MPYAAHSSMVFHNKSKTADIVGVDFNTALNAYNASKAYGYYAGNDVVIRLDNSGVTYSSCEEDRFASLDKLK